jgi:hypothetical protein
MRTRTVIEDMPQDISPDKKHIVVFDRTEMTTDALVLVYKYVRTEEGSD